MGEHDQPTAPTVSQIIIGYEGEPYMVFDADEAMIEEALSTSDLSSKDWSGETNLRLREAVALMRDHGDEVLFDEERRWQVAKDAILICSYTAAAHKRKLIDCPGTVLIYYSAQSALNPRFPKLSVAILHTRVTPDEIRASSSAKYLLSQDADDLRSITNLTPEVDARLQGRGQAPQCVQIDAYWKNDGADGLHYVADGSVIEAFEQAVIMFGASRHHTREECEALLTEYAKILRDGNARATAPIEAMTVIAYMEEAGLLVSDEYNGIVYFYRTGDAIEIVRADKPKERRKL